jgi:hypothetical protein
MQVLVGLIVLQIKFSCIMLKLPVRRPVQMRAKHLNIMLQNADGRYTDQQNI